MSAVYFFETRKNSDILVEAGNKISALFSDFFGLEDRLAIKLHFGESKSTSYLSPVLAQTIWNNIKNKVKAAVLMDCTVLYKSERSFASSHRELAKDHGFGFAPIVIADGEKGDEEAEVVIHQKHFEKVKLGAKIAEYNSILAISHFKGHSDAGFGGSLKNLGMGFGSKRGKLEMHNAFLVKSNPELCVACQTCLRECPAKAIFMENKIANIDYEKCIGCGQCVSVCPRGAMEIPWGANSSRDLQEKIVEYAFGALKGRKAFFINALLNITSRCDCVRQVLKPIMKDIGILASFDVVALEQASLDLAGADNFRKPGVDPEVQINYAAELGLGTKDYNLVRIN